MKNNKYKILGKQAYINNDVKRGPPRDLATFMNYIFPILKDNLRNNAKMIDIGSGNGRMSAFLKNHFEEVNCIEPNTDYKFIIDKQHVHHVTLENCKIIENDLALVCGVAYLYDGNFSQYKIENFCNHLKRITKKGGIICVSGDPKNQKNAIANLENDKSLRLIQHISFTEFEYYIFRRIK